MSSLKQDEITRVVVRLWAIWFARRKAIHENQFQSLFSTHTFVEWFIGELEEINQESPEVLPVAAPVPRWVRPPSGLAKINVDAAMSKNSGQAAEASVSRDDAGNYFGVVCPSGGRAHRPRGDGGCGLPRRSRIG